MSRQLRQKKKSICCDYFSFSQKTDGDMTNLNLGELDLTTDEFILDEVDSKTSLIIYKSHI